MLSLPPGFDSFQFLREVFTFASPFITLGLIVGSFFLLVKILRRV